MGKLKLEEAVRIIDGVLDRAETVFYSENKRYPSLVDERDYVLLARHLNIPDEAEKTKYVNSEGHNVYGIPHEDFAYRFMRRYLERQNFFSSLGTHQQTAFDAFIGRLNCHVPRRERDFRIENIEELRKSKIEFPLDFKPFLKTIGKIAGEFPTPGVCFLKRLRRDNREAYEEASHKIGTHLVNPSAHLFMWLMPVINYETLIKRWYEAIGDDIGTNYD